MRGINYNGTMSDVASARCGAYQIGCDNILSGVNSGYAAHKNGWLRNVFPNEAATLSRRFTELVISKANNDAVVPDSVVAP